MRAQDFANKCANVFLFGLPIVVFGTPAIAMILANIASGAADLIRTAFSGIAYIGYIGIPIIGLAGACVGIWCYVRKDYQHKFYKQILVLVILVIYVWAATIATEVYKSMVHKTALNASTPLQAAMKMTSKPSIKRDALSECYCSLL